MTRRSWLSTLAWVLVACGDPQPAATPRPSEPADPLATIDPPSREPIAAPPIERPEPALELGPALEAGPDARRRTLLALLSDGKQAELLPLADVDPGASFDPDRVDELAPRIGVPRVMTPPPSVEGDLDREVVRRVTRAHTNEVRRCYDAALGDAPRTSGRVVLDYSITSEGRVSVVAVTTDTLNDDEVSTCMARRLKSWRFPKPGDRKPVAVSQEFGFEAG
ncbi:AgmX/PglI C-terminal domain-containing protein [Nannocystaceae bacterium ST9]